MMSDAETSKSAGSAGGTGGGDAVNVVETVQSLVVAFVLAMMFRGFVTEGFVIPTGSMAPTLYGAHAKARGNESGYVFAVDSGNGPELPQRMMGGLADPLASPEEDGSASVVGGRRPRMGDRILVLKSMYPFFEPKRFDVVVFKNPTNPIGDESNFIKRLIGLPNEQVWLADGDVFVKKRGASDFEIQRKPEYVQRAVWQPVWDSDFTNSYDTGPWIGMDSLTRNGREYDIDPAGGELELEWDYRTRGLVDYTAYNQTPYYSQDFSAGRFPVADLRIASTL
ncbi:MAG TPA: S26 family signal peptidase, partial [Phycisphaerales bacterium]|nr:S26 family signal peptidase [Phycisphaerales bacterium]